MSPQHFKQILYEIGLPNLLNRKKPREWPFGRNYYGSKDPRETKTLHLEIFLVDCHDKRCEKEKRTVEKNGFVLCKAGEEALKHLLIECPIAKIIRAQSLWPIRFFEMQLTCITDWVKVVLYSRKT